MTEYGAFWDDLNADLQDPDVAADFAANRAAIQAVDKDVNEQRVFGIDPIPGGAIVTGHRDGNGVLHSDGVQPIDRETLAAWVASLTEKMRPVFEAMRAQFEALCTALRPLAEALADLHERYPDPADWVIEPEPENCFHLCSHGPEHECAGEADGTYVYPHGDGHKTPMCTPCQDAAVAGLWAGGKTCAHVCGPDPDHACEAGAERHMRYTLPSGTSRALPLCLPCYDSEMAEMAHA